MSIELSDAAVFGVLAIGVPVLVAYIGYYHKKRLREAQTEAENRIQLRAAIREIEEYKKRLEHYISLVDRASLIFEFLERAYSDAFTRVSPLAIVPQQRPVVAEKTKYHSLETDSDDTVRNIYA